MAFPTLCNMHSREITQFELNETAQLLLVNYPTQITVYFRKVLLHLANANHHQVSLDAGMKFCWP